MNIGNNNNLVNNDNDITNLGRRMKEQLQRSRRAPPLSPLRAAVRRHHETLMALDLDNPSHAEIVAAMGRSFAAPLARWSSCGFD